MKQSIQRMLQEVPYKVHVIVKEANADDYIFSECFDEVFSSASLIKVPILLAVLDHVERNHESLNQVIAINPENRVDFSVLTEQYQEKSALYELLVWMIITSDNTATNVLIDYIGMEALNDYFRKIGLTKTRLQRKMMDFERLKNGFDNVTTARDMAHLFTRIYRKDVLTQPFSILAIEILSRQRDHEKLKRYLVGNVKIAHKTGGLDTVDHDVGIVYSDTQDYIIGVFVTEVTNNDDARLLIGRISKVVYTHLVGNEERFI
ncbi:serine hydrolase [Solibacillus sp. FSL H8-0538]|uniref:serine hydrolase n=1 Tax=Solibacillus sp. FSL H8-0538 TaxID=2921400 RepID=UPI0030F8AA59